MEAELYHALLYLTAFLVLEGIQFMFPGRVIPEHWICLYIGTGLIIFHFVG
jgi:hypothetical protein